MHVSPEELLDFLAGKIGPGDNERIRGHLDTCNDCFEDYQLAARVQGLDEVLPGGLTSPRPAPVSGPRRPPRLFSRRFAWAASAAVVLLIVAVGIWISSVEREPASRLSAEVIEPIHATAVELANRSLVVLPGTEAAIDAEPALMRSGAPSGGGELTRAVSALMTRYEAGDRSPELLYWLAAGFAVNGQTSTARDVAIECLQQHPDDADCNVLLGVIDIGEGRFEEAAERLGAVVAAHPDHTSAAINLGVALIESGRRDEARAVLSALRERVSDPTLRARVSWLLDATDGS